MVGCGATIREYCQHQGINVPASYKQALRSAEWSHWQEAIDTEYKSLQERQTWTLVVKPAGRKIIDSKWVFKIKRNSDGTIARYKARLVARGFTQEHGRATLQKKIS